MGVKVISVGNLIVGGSGKTPVTLSLAQKHKDSAIVLRGYKRASKGLVVVSLKGKIQVDIKQSGDEAMLYAQSLKNSTVIVSEDRKKGILKAKSLGAKIVFLDDGFSKFNIKKFDILLKPNQKLLPFCLPSGAYRFPPFFYKYADLVLEEDIDFTREVKIKNKTSNMIFLTAISKPKRLEKYLPKDILKIYLPDHSDYSKEFIDKIIKNYNPTSILTTTKDEVKLKSYNLPLSILELKINFKTKIRIP